jgi:hypothetical protein
MKKVFGTVAFLGLAIHRVKENPRRINPMNKLRDLIQVAGIIAVCSAPMFAQNNP